MILSGDLLQQFLIVTFNKLDRGDIWDDEFELNTMLQVWLCLELYSAYTWLCFPSKYVV